jgi:branched-chain amino acid transport system ATP-binding protein
MLALARAYITEPRVVLVDEASLGLAPLVVDLVFDFLHELVSRGASLVIVDQFISRALAMTSYAYILSHGSVAAEGTPADLGRDDVFQTYFGE